MGAAASGAGAVGSSYINLKSRQDAALSEKKNAAGLMVQAQDAQDVFDRRLHLLQRDQDKYLGSLDSAFAKSGIDFSGSALDIYAETTGEMRLERSALTSEAASVQNRFNSEIESSRQRASALTDPVNMGLTMLGSGLSFAGSQMGKGQT